MAEPLLSVKGLRVDYEDITAVDDVSFSVEAGMVYGLIGPNGAGKTSIIRVIATLLQPTYGQVQVCGIDLVADPLHALQHLGFMPDMPPLYEDLFVEEFLELFASAYGLSGAARTKRHDRHQPPGWLRGDREDRRRYRRGRRQGRPPGL